MTDTFRRPDLTVVVPYFNRSATVQATLESVEMARKGLEVETILVDDGSTPSAVEQLRGLRFQPDRVVRQDNRGLLFARLAGLSEAAGEFVLFLDSDDLVGPDKFVAQVSAMRAGEADVSYTDCAQVDLAQRHDPAGLHSREVTEDTAESAVFFVRVQPAPHSPIFRTSWLRGLVEAPLFPPSPLYNPVAEIWFYHVAAPVPATVVKVPGTHTLVGSHAGERLTNHWERLGVSSLAVMEAFHRGCPRVDSTASARRLVGEKAFLSWRALPYDFNSDFDRRLLAIWRAAPKGSLDRLGGKRFQMLAQWIGPVAAARILRRWIGKPYRDSRTLDDDSMLGNWLAELPTP